MARGGEFTDFEWAPDQDVRPDLKDSDEIFRRAKAAPRPVTTPNKNMYATIARASAAIYLAFAALCFLSACESKKDKKLAAIDSALAANQYQMQRFNSDAANVNRFAEGFAKGYEGNVPGIARDAAAAYSTAAQLDENDRQLRAYRQQLATSGSSDGWPRWLLMVVALAIAGVVKAASGKKKT